MHAVRVAAWVSAALFLLPVATASAAETKTQYYLSLGDSLSVGVQPGPANNPGNGVSVNTNEGYTDQLYALAKKQRAYRGLKLVKAGCGGATTNSFINGGPGVVGGVNCAPARTNLQYRNTNRSSSQLAYAEDFLRDHRGQVAFVTFDIGNNNFTACASATGIDLSCVAQGLGVLNQQMPTIVQRLRRAAGPKTPIIGATFYNPFYAIWLRGSPAAAEGLQPATQSVNQGLKDAYAPQKVLAASIDGAFNTYAPFSQTQPFQGLDPIPVAVATICNYTWNCGFSPSGPNIHANETGYGVMAKAFYDALRKG